MVWIIVMGGLLIVWYFLHRAHRRVESLIREKDSHIERAHAELLAFIDELNESETE